MYYSHDVGGGGKPFEPLGITLGSNSFFSLWLVHQGKPHRCKSNEIR